MALIINANLLAAAELVKAGVDIDNEEHSLGTEFIRILVVNLMPKKNEAEFQFLNICSKADFNIQFDFLHMESHQPKNTKHTYLKENYKTLKDVRDEEYHGIIITGAPLEFVDFKDVEYWQELEEVMVYAREKARSTIYVCWASIVGLYLNYGIEKRLIEKKLFGVFPHNVLKKEDLLLRGIQDGFMVPHSRYIEIRKEDILQKTRNLEVLSESEEGGISMQIKELFERKNLVFSFEVFPPKVTSPIETIYDTLEGLKDLKPDYISVTYGAGGNGNDNRTGEIAAIIKNKYDIEALAHLTCIGSTIEETTQILEELKHKGVHNVLALRGDIPEGFEGTGALKNSQDLIRLIREGQGSRFGIAAACYPEGHVGGKDVDKDIEILKLKEAAGADHAITQLFFDNNYFYEFLNKVEQKGIKLPIQAGIMPVTNKKQIERIIALSGANLPEKFKKIMDKYEHNKEALRDAGIAYALDQIVDLISTGASGIHLYTMNNPYIARSVTASIGSILESVNREKEVV